MLEKDDYNNDVIKVAAAVAICKVSGVMEGSPDGDFGGLWSEAQVAEHPYMFERFFRATNVENIQGTGLGLNIVKRYLELINGKISFISEEGKGSTFFIELIQSSNQ